MLSNTETCKAQPSKHANALQTHQFVVWTEEHLSAKPPAFTYDCKRATCATCSTTFCKATQRARYLHMRMARSFERRQLETEIERKGEMGERRAAEAVLKKKHICTNNKTHTQHNTRAHTQSYIYIYVHNIQNTTHNAHKHKKNEELRCVCKSCTLYFKCVRVCVFLYLYLSFASFYSSSFFLLAALLRTGFSAHYTRFFLRQQRWQKVAIFLKHVWK